MMINQCVNKKLEYRVKPFLAFSDSIKYLHYCMASFLTNACKLIRLSQGLEVQCVTSVP
jgi:hypothetical protein